MEPIYQKPMDIEARSMAIIEEHLTGVTLPEPERSILKRVIHTTADFDYTENLCFSENAVSSALEALQRGAHIVTDTNMALSGINKRSLHGLGCEAYCFMSDADVAEEAKARGVTRAMVSMEKACRLDGNLIFAVGNAPTALIQLDELIRAGKLLPKLIIGVPVGFVNVVFAAMTPGSAAAMPAAAMMTLIPRPAAFFANSSTASGVRCAERAFISKGTCISSSNLAAFSITGRSEVLPMIMLTIGFIVFCY